MVPGLDPMLGSGPSQMVGCMHVNEHCLCRAIQLTGPFVTMVFKIITNDMVTFFIIYSIFLLSFSQAFFFLYKGSSSRDSSKFATYIDTWMGLFHMTLGDYDVSGSGAEPARSPTCPMTSSLSRM